MARRVNQRPMQPTLTSGAPEQSTRDRPAVFPYGRVDGPSRWPARSATLCCPHCAEPSVNAQGVAHCPDCDWTTRP